MSASIRGDQTSKHKCAECGEIFTSRSNKSLVCGKSICRWRHKNGGPMLPPQDGRGPECEELDREIAKWGDRMPPDRIEARRKLICKWWEASDDQR